MWRRHHGYAEPRAPNGGSAATLAEGAAQQVLDEKQVAFASRSGPAALRLADLPRSATLVAARAMLATSVTTSIAFLTNYISYIPPVRMMGLFAAVCVMVNYAIAVTLLPATLRRSRQVCRMGALKVGDKPKPYGDPDSVRDLLA